MEARGEGGSCDLRAAGDHFRLGAKAGDAACFGELGLMYPSVGESDSGGPPLLALDKLFSGARKCWSSYFARADSLSLPDRKNYTALYRMKSPDADFYLSLDRLTAEVDAAIQYYRNDAKRRSELSDLQGALHTEDLRSVPLCPEQPGRLAKLRRMFDEVAPSVGGWTPREFSKG